jgi:Ca2+-binding EF-hand superfamily protein
MSPAENSEFKIPAEIEELIPPEKLKKIKQAFDQLDLNHDGRIDREEYLEHLLAKERERFIKRFDYLDKDHDGSIDFEEFVTASEPNYPLLKRFKDFDANLNGLLSVDEALQIAEEFNFPITRDWLEKQIHRVDHKGRKLISYNEYLGAVTRFGFQ